ncbi:MAG: biotin--[acetyl-CoA-carboxylase] ligase [Bacteroidetes bacterium]|nr:biotin--[acetyl-CoA-carboxylase] ligase [Bacteroidota bacterium]
MNKELTTLFTGRNIISIKEIDSTSSYLLALMRERQVPEGTLVRTQNQQSGRGQLGTRWHSEEGKNLLMSLLFYPTFIVPKSLFLLNKAYALGVYDFAVTMLGGDVKIKWPNDIYWKTKKLGGLLIENSISTGVVNNSVLGIGLNVNEIDFPSTLPNPTSIAKVRPGNYDLNEMMHRLCNSIEARYLQLKRGEKSLLDHEYHKALFRFEEWSFYEDKKGKFPGCIRGVDNQGQLKVEDEDGEIRYYDLKEIKFLGLS